MEYLLVIVLMVVMIGQLAVGAVLFNRFQSIEEEKIKFRKLQYELQLDIFRAEEKDKERMYETMKKPFADETLDGVPIESADQLTAFMNSAREEISREKMA